MYGFGLAVTQSELHVALLTLKSESSFKYTPMTLNGSNVLVWELLRERDTHTFIYARLIQVELEFVKFCGFSSRVLHTNLTMSYTFICRLTLEATGKFFNFSPPNCALLEKSNDRGSSFFLFLNLLMLLRMRFLTRERGYH